MKMKQDYRREQFITLDELPDFKNEPCFCFTFR